MIVSHLIEVVLITALGFLLRWENKKRDRIQSQMEGGLEGRDLGATAFMDLTDRENLKYVCPPCHVTVLLTVYLASGIFIKFGVVDSVYGSGRSNFHSSVRKCMSILARSFRRLTTSTTNDMQTLIDIVSGVKTV